MKKKLSAYWWCQIGGWGFNTIANIVNGVFNPYSWSYRNMSADVFFFRLLIVSLLGIVLTHFMRWVIIRFDILQKKFKYQVIYLLLITLVFSVMFSFSSLGMFQIFDLLKNNEIAFTFPDLMYGGIFYSFLVLLIWNLIYFIYHYVQRVRRQQIDLLQRELLENELIRQKLENEKTKIELQHQATELEMQALRAQMNPHFIFNSLNSINRFILQNNRTQASEYLTKFSKLVRMILENSQASAITLESELESLELYLEMEALRFDYHFAYKISVPKDMDIEVLKVPPLIIQPYVENAIWHGLMHKEEKGKINIEVFEENEYLYLKVADNGIGRKQAALLASKSATKHKSMGLRITADRIAMLQNSNGIESPVTINDLVNADGISAGTEVIIKMPVIYD